VNKGEWIALEASLDGHDPVSRAAEVEAFGYMLAYARQTDAEVLAVAISAERGAYKLLFSFNRTEDLLDFLRLLHLNPATGRTKIYVPQASEIRSARPLSSVLPVEIVPQIMQFAAGLLSYLDRRLDVG
jgi:hypothetical protein